MDTSRLYNGASAIVDRARPPTKTQDANVTTGRLVAMARTRADGELIERALLALPELLDIYEEAHTPFIIGELVDTPDTAAKAFRRAGIIGMQENFMALAVNARGRRIGDPWLVARGTTTNVMVGPSDVFRQAITRGAVSIIVAHNHPSEDPSPSAEDEAMTERLVAAANCLGVLLHDHLVITRGAYTSLAELGVVGPAAPIQHLNVRRP